MRRCTQSPAPADAGLPCAVSGDSGGGVACEDVIRRLWFERTGGSERKAPEVTCKDLEKR